VGTKAKPRKLPKRQGVAKPLTMARLISLADGKYKDPGQQGLYILVRDKADGSKSRTWLHRIKRRGKDTPLVVGHYPETGLAEARTLVQAQRELVSKGIDPASAAPRRKRPKALGAAAGPAPATLPKHSIEFLAHEFMELHVKVNHEDPSYTQRILNREVLSDDGWKGRDARTIKPREVIELLDKIVARGSKVMANRTGTMLDHMFKFGIHRDIVETSPVQLLYRPGGKESSRERCLTDEELKALLTDPNDLPKFERLVHVIRILLLTGQRRGELALARWIDIDFEQKIWNIPAMHTKTDKAHTVPLSDFAIEGFKALKALTRNARHVLPNEAADGPVDPKLLTRGVARREARMKKLGISEFTLHDLRRTCRTGLARLKIAPHIAERVLNHAQEKIPGTYDTHGYLDEKRDALDKWAAHLEELVRMK
jgi:integrase